MSMCPTWYLSMPAGTIFGFRINARATLQHLHDAEIEKQMDEEDAKAKLMVGYVRDVSPNGLDIGLLVSQGQAYDDTRASVDSLTPVLRRGLAVDSKNITSSASGSDSTRSRRQSHPIFDPSSAIFNKASSHNSVGAGMVLPALQRQPKEGLITAILKSAPPLRPTAALPWEQAYAYRPKFGGVVSQTRAHDHGSTGSFRVPPGARHRLLVGNYCASGVPVRPQTRFARTEVMRAEKVMDGLLKEEQEEIEEKLRERELIASFEMPDSPPLSSSGSDTSSLRSDDSVTTEGSFTSVNLCDDQADSRSRSRSTTAAPSRPLSIVIDIFLNVESIKTLPESPEEFEHAVARLESMERCAKSRTVSKIDGWTDVLKDADTWKTNDVKNA